MKQPKLAGVWACCCTPQCELIQWGIDGGTEFPYTSGIAAIKQCNYLKDCDDNLKDAQFFVLYVFENGQIKQEILE